MKEAKQILGEILKADKIVITSHRSPDGDSVGSSLGMYQFIKALGKESIVCHPDPCPRTLEWVKNGVVIHEFDEDPEFVENAMRSADLIFCLDYNGAMRVGEDMGNLLVDCKATKIMIDHHPHPEDFVDIDVTNTSVGSTCELVYELIDHSGKLDLLNKDMATPIYLGIMTDTGSFRYSSVSPRTHDILSHLLSTGIDHTRIHENTFDDVHLDSLKLRGYAISQKLEVIPHYHIAYIWLTQDELERFNYRKGDTDGLVNVALSVEDVMVAAFFSEKDGQIKISFRSKDKIPVNTIAIEEFNGGGHLNASGGFSADSMEDTLKRFKSLIPKYFGELSAL